MDTSTHPPAGFTPGLGESDFRLLRREGKDIIDKSGLISELLEDPSRIVLFPRPRRFGKTTNLNMVRYFFERSDEDRSDLFADLKVWMDPKARVHFQAYPVIYVTFKDIKFSTWEHTLGNIRRLFSALFRQYDYLCVQPFLSDSETKAFQAIVNETAELVDYQHALRDLSRWLSLHHNTGAVLLIDEYDTPIYAAYRSGYSDPMLEFMRVLLGGALKDNPFLFKGVLTGIMRVARESLFSGLNNLSVYSMLESRYVDAFGFTEAEVAYICGRLGRPDLLNGMREMYNGYVGDPRATAIPIYNPWSVLSCVADPLHEITPHWVNTSSDELLRDLMIKQGHALNGAFEKLLAGGEEERPLDEFVALRDLETRDDVIWSFLWYAGYLKVTRVWLDERTRRMAAFAIPNREVGGVFSTVFLSWLSRADMGGTLQRALEQALLEGDADTLELILSRLLLTNFSYHDGVGREPEKLYHGLVMGLLVYLEGRYEVRSNPESGYGRVDVLIKPRKPGNPGVVMELKVLHEGATVESSLKKALDQVQKKAYATQLEAAGASPVHTFGILFDGKKTWVVTPETWSQRFGTA